MQRIALRLLFVFVLLSCAAGCHRGGAAIFATGFIVGNAIASAGHHHDEHEHTTHVYVVERAPPVIVSPAAVPAPAPRDRSWKEEGGRLPFDAKAARTALSSVDLAACRDAGAPRGYGHAKVSFNPSGEPSKVVVDEPAGLSPAAVKCIGDGLGRASVPGFDGSFVTVGTTYFVP